MSKKNKKQVQKEVVEHSSLVLFNCQNDFLSNKGKMKDVINAPEGFSEKLAEEILTLDNVDHIVIVKSVYNKKDPQLEMNGGDVPNHCLAGTSGADVVQVIMNACNKLLLPTQISIVNIHNTIGKEDYGAFTVSNNYSGLSPKEEPQPKHCYFSNINGESGVRFMNQKLIFMGVNYMNTIEDSIDNLMRSWKFNIVIDKNFIASDDDFSIMRECADDYKTLVDFREN